MKSEKMHAIREMHTEVNAPMSTILAVDTSSEACSIALLKEGQVFAEFVEAPRQHTQRLLPMIDALLSAQGVKPSELDAIAYGRGPGSFTGLRICLGVVQGLAFSADVPVIPVSTLETMAQGAISRFRLPLGHKILTVLDARMSEIYGGLFENCEGSPKAVIDEFVGAPSDLDGCQPLSETPVAELTKIGAGCHYSDIQSISASQEVQTFLPRAEDMLPLAEKALLAGKVVRAEDAQPVYLRDSVAWKKRERIRQ